MLRLFAVSYHSVIITVLLYIRTGSRDSSVGIATRLRAGQSRNRGSISGRRNTFICSPKCPDRLLGPTQSPIQWVQGHCRE